jgi:uncharacterized protein YjbI with pentapeptide repeats
VSERRRRLEVGVTKAPELDVDQLEAVAVEALVPRFEFEGVRLDDTELGGAEAGSGRFEQVLLAGVRLDGAKLRGVRMVDVRGERLGAANGDWSSGSLSQVEIANSRLTGLSLGATELSQVRFRECKLDYANFRHAKLAEVTFEDCVLARADFQGAGLRSTRFDGCRLRGADFTKAELERVDLRGSALEFGGSLLGLRGAIIDSLQLMDISHAIAHELGISVEER